MKTIIIIRHAKSSWDDFRMTDFERPLDKRGLRDAPVMAAMLRAGGYNPEILYSSNAKRAFTTAQFFAKEFGMDIHEVPSLYHGHPEDYMRVIRETDDSISCIALFGHNPGITILANYISSGCTDNIPTCGIIIAQWNSTTWESCDWQKMKLLTILTPKGNNHE